MTDGERVLAMFRHHEGEWVNHRHIIVDMGISEYTGRIGDARGIILCRCGEKGVICSSDQHIVNVKRGWYMYSDNRPKVVMTQVNIESSISEKLYQLNESIFAIQHEINEVNTYRQIALREKLQVLETQKKILLLATRKNEPQNPLISTQERSNFVMGALA